MSTTPTQQWVSLNGELMRAEEARVSVFDAGFMHGIGLFETMRAYDGRVFRLQRHLDRLVASARKFGWTVLPDPAELAGNIQQVIAATATSTAGDLRVRLTVTTGALHAAGGEAGRLTTVAMASPEEKYPDEMYLKGVTVLLSECWQSSADPLVGHKTTSYFARLASLRAVHVRSAFEALWLTPDGDVAEGAISNVFAVLDDVLVTPPLDTPVLPGITRAAVLELAQELGITTREQMLSVDELLGGEEAFLTNSMFEIMPIVRLGRDRIGNEKPGDITRKLAVAYTDAVNRECLA